MDEKKSKLERRAPIAVLLAGLMFFLMGSALTQPPIDSRGIRFTLAGTPLTTADTDINFLTLNKGPCCAITVCNDNAGGGSDVYFSVVNGVTSAAAGTDGTISTTIPVIAGEKVSLDGRFTHCVLRSSGGNSAARVIPSFDR